MSPIKKRKRAAEIPEDNAPVTARPPVHGDHDTDETDSEALARGDVPMSLVDHLKELRTRLIYCVAALVVLTLIGFIFADWLIAVITDPISQFGHTLNIFKLAGGFILKVKVAFFSAIIITIPLILFQIWRFVVPAVSREARTFARLSIFLSTLMFYTGVFFVFHIILPYVLRILLRFIGSEYVPTLGADDYLTFLLYFSIAMGLLFQFPIAVALLTRIGIITPYFLRTRRRYSYVAIILVAAVITPADLISQILASIPLIILYEISIVISRFMVMREKKREMRLRRRKNS